MEKFLRQWRLPNASRSDDRNNDPVVAPVQENSLIFVAQTNNGQANGNVLVSGNNNITPTKSLTNTISPIIAAPESAVVPQKNRKQ